MTKPTGPVLIDLDVTKGGPKSQVPQITPSTAPPVPEPATPPSGQAMQRLATMAARRPSALGRWFWRLLGGLISFALTLWVWDFVTGLIARNTYLGYAALALVALFVLVCFAIILREWAAFSRLQRLDGIHKTAVEALSGGDLGAARKVVKRLDTLYLQRPELKWGRQNLANRQDELLDADGLFALAESQLLVPLDVAAKSEVEAAARQVATVTAIVPLAFADVIAALTANLRMIRRIAEIYGGRAGTLGSWRLTRTVLTHLVATGAVAVGDDLISSIAGGGILSKVSRRFGEGVINGALTARVGVAAIEVCRPLPFLQAKRPSVTGIVQRALGGLFATTKS